MPFQNVLLMKESAEYHASSPSPPRHQCCYSVTQFSIRFLDCMPGFPILFQLLELAQTHVHQVSDAIHHLILCCSLLFLPSVFPGIRVFSSKSALHIRCPSTGASASASVLLMNIQGRFPLGLTGLILLSKGLSRVFSSTTIQKHQFVGARPSS